MSNLAFESGKTGQWEWRRLRVGDALLEVIPARGAIATRWEAPAAGQPRPLLWLRPDYYDQPRGETHRLGGGIPLLFPNCGVVERDGVEGRYVIDGRPFQMPGHGFGPHAAYAVGEPTAAEGGATIAMTLRDTAATFAIYPFAFEATVRYTLREHALRFDWTVENRSPRAMPLAPGLHPYFRLPFTDAGRRGDVTVETHGQRLYLPNEPVRVWSGRTAPLAGGGMLRLGDLPVGRPTTVGDLARPEFEVVDPASGVRLRASWPAPTAEMEGPWINLWTPDEETPTYCVEPFLGLQNALNHRRGLIEIQPGEQWKWWMEMAIDEK